jgi:hypothetical protein
MAQALPELQSVGSLDLAMLGPKGKPTGAKIPILLFAEDGIGIQPYDWQCQILLSFEAGFPTAAAACNFSGKTSMLFPTAGLWLLYCFPRARAMYLSSTGSQVKNQFFAALSRFRYRPAFAASLPNRALGTEIVQGLCLPAIFTAHSSRSSISFNHSYAGKRKS